MLNSKRLIVAVASGFVMGLACYVGGLLLFHLSFTPAEIANIFVNRMLIGFVIGISALRMSWYTHGMVVGLVVGLPFLLYGYISGKGLWVVITVAFLNPLFGLAIEYVTSVLCRQELKSR
jgi:hypothetical protein